HVPFFLDDNTGRVLVDPQGAEMDIHRDFQEEFDHSVLSGSLELPGNVTSFLARHGVAPEHKIKVEEHCIKPKNALFILGTLAEKPSVAVHPSPSRQFPRKHHQLNLQPPGPTTKYTEKTTFTITTFNGDLASEKIVHLGGGNQPTHALDMTQQQKIAAAL